MLQEFPLSVSGGEGQRGGEWEEGAVPWSKGWNELIQKSTEGLGRKLEAHMLCPDSRVRYLTLLGAPQVLLGVIPGYQC